MASISLTYTLTNGTAADASQVMQNFNDLVNGTSDGTKDFSISALTCAGIATLNGNVAIGNASSDDLTITASLASSIVIKTTNSYDIGASTLALRSVYLASSDSAARATRVIGATVASSYTLTLPISGGTANYGLITDGSGTTSWQKPFYSKSDCLNYAIACSVSANALTITVKGGDGNNLSSTNYATMIFRNATIATGTWAEVSATSNLTLTISSGSTLGHANSKLEYIYLYAINNAGTIELAASSSLFDDSGVISTTAEGGAGAADSATVLYSTTARSNIACRLIGILQSTQTTAGTWAAVPTTVSHRIEPRYTLGSTQVFTATGTWTRPAGCRAVKVIVTGGGGGGGGTTTTVAGEGSEGACGGGGGTAIKFITRGLGSTETVTVGTGGTAGATGGGTGGNGNASSFGSHCTGNSGSGASGAGATSGSTNAAGASGGTATGGDINITGGGGHNGRVLSGLPVSIGSGGCTLWGAGGAKRSNVNGAAGDAYGSGGAGSVLAASQTQKTGGAGADGIVVVEEYY